MVFQAHSDMVYWYRALDAESRAALDRVLRLDVSTLDALLLIAGQAREHGDGVEGVPLVHQPQEPPFHRG